MSFLLSLFFAGGAGAGKAACPSPRPTCGRRSSHGRAVAWAFLFFCCAHRPFGLRRAHMERVVGLKCLIAVLSTCGNWEIGRGQGEAFVRREKFGACACAGAEKPHQHAHDSHRSAFHIMPGPCPAHAKPMPLSTHYPGMRHSSFLAQGRCVRSPGNCHAQKRVLFLVEMLECRRALSRAEDSSLRRFPTECCVWRRSRITVTTQTARNP